MKLLKAIVFLSVGVLLVLVAKTQAVGCPFCSAAMQTLGQEIGATGIGRVQLMDWLLEDNTSWPSFLSGGWHHMGTTRMHEDPKQGVVDADCKVHGLGNLYVASASAYTTGGAANPTLTLIALTLRLSDYLKRQVS